MSLESAIQSTAKSPGFNLASQALRLAGCGAGIALLISGRKTPVSDTALLVVAIAPSLRLPFHATHALNKAMRAGDGSQSPCKRIASSLGALFLGTLSLRIALQGVGLFTPLPVAPLSALLGSSLSYIKAAEMGLLIGDALNSKEGIQDPWELVNCSIELVASTAMMSLTPISISAKDLVGNLSSFYLGFSTIWSVLPQDPSIQKESHRD